MSDKRQQLGKKFELEVFGVSSNIDLNNRRLKVSFAAAKKEALINQPIGWNPANPPTPIARRLLESVAAHLPEARRSLLLLYVGVGTVIDECYGVDCFFTLADDPTSFFGIDITNRHEPVPGKRRKRKKWRPATHLQIDHNGTLQLPRGSIADRSPTEIDAVYKYLGKTIAGKLSKKRPKKHRREDAETFFETH